MKYEEFKKQMAKKIVIKEIQKKFLKEAIFWIKDWEKEGKPYGVKGLIKKLNKI